MIIRLIILLWCILSYTAANSTSLILLSPADNTTDATLSPVFCWVMVPGNSSNLNLVYSFKIAEYDAGLGEAGSLSTNLLFSEAIYDNNDNVCYQYPGSAPVLENCSTYVWQVKVSSITLSETEPFEPVETVLATSEIYTLSTYCEEEPPIAPSGATNLVYMVPKKRPDNFVYLVKSDSLNIKYEELYSNSEIHYSIFGASDSSIANNESFNTIHAGLNYFSIPLTGLDIDESSAETPKIYRLEIYTPKGEILQLKFEKIEN